MMSKTEPQVERSTQRAETRVSRDHRSQDGQIAKDLERFAAWLGVVRLLRGPVFGIALAVLGAMAIVVSWLSWQGLEPGILGGVFVALGFGVFWVALMTAFAGWILRSDIRAQCPRKGGERLDDEPAL